MKHICMITVDHSPLDNRIFYQEALSLERAGYRVSIICAGSPDGEVWNMGGNRLLNPNLEKEFDLDGVTVHVVSRPKSKSQLLKKKIFRGQFYGAFAQLGKLLKPDLFIAHEPESLYLAFRLSNNQAHKVLFDAHESWLGGSRKDRIVKHRYLSRLQFLITANEMTKGHLLKENPKIKAEVIYNFPNPEIVESHFLESKLDNPILVHEGMLPFNRGLKTLIETLIILKTSMPNIQLKLIGNCPAEEQRYLDQKIEQHQLDKNIIQTGWVDYKNISEHLKDCSIGFISKDKSVLNNLMGGPGIKLFNYFFNGICTIDVGLHESSRFLDRFEAGVTVGSDAPDQIAKVLLQLLQDEDSLKRYCINAFEAHKACQWTTEAAKLNNYLDRYVFNSSQSIFR